METTDKNLDWKSITTDDIRSVYSGVTRSCMCGCKGNHRYNPKHLDEARRSRGYEITADEVNVRQVKRVLEILQSAETVITSKHGNAITTVGKRDYVVYFTEAATVKLFAE